ncbi:MAG TPA: sensor histidine kinase [Thermomicrobiales bacterium]|nr:sensor histidine kinase [Thermomicrobiales bacterium]
MATEHMRPVFYPGWRRHGLLRAAFSSEPWRAAAFMLSSFVLGIFWFVVLVTLLATGSGMAVGLIGIPILIAAVYVWQQGARSERWRIGALLQEPIPDPYRPTPAGSWWDRFKSLVTDWAIWRDLLYLILLFPIGVIEFVILVLVLTIPVTLLSMPIVWLTGNQANVEIGSVLSWNLNSVSGMLSLGAIGIPALMLGLLAIVATGRAHLAFAKALLGPGERAQLEQKVVDLRDSRARVMDAEMMELRRIERDLHDGAQQWLVATAIDLAMAKDKLESEPEAARELIDKAGSQTRQALTDIRNLVRGISPAILVDRGLDPAISALAVRCPIPVHVDVDIERRLPEAVETTAYFIVAEALTNIAKHANATEARITARLFSDRLLLEIMDNGPGGADPRGGTGLTGLKDRASALDGELRIESPTGGPTRIRAELPCAS